MEQDHPDQEAESDDPTTSSGFRGTQVRDDGTGPVLVAHRQRLVVVTGPDRGLEKEIESTRLAIGTSSTNDLVLADTTVSRRHCEINVRGEKYTLRDLGSTNGTVINGTPVVEAYLSPGARIRLGDTEILFEPKKKFERVTASAVDHYGELYGASAQMRAVFGLLGKVALTDLSCILVGETGTGKELAARALHEHSARSGRPFVVVDCGAISENLIESELFGHERGAFTGADRARAGAFELANGGTIFLDEIGELPLDLQPKLLRALERREVKRLGAARPIEVDVRVIAATHRDLPAMIKDGRFREDIYYRLAEVVVELPPLRTRKEDIPLIANRIVNEDAASTSGSGLHGGRAKTIDPEAMRELLTRQWPGNVRELRNVLRRALAMSTSDSLRVQDLAQIGAGRPGPAVQAAGGGEVQQGTPQLDVAEELPIKEARDRWVSPMEREYLIRLLKRTGGDLDKAANDAGVHRKSLERLLRQHGLRAADMRDED